MRKNFSELPELTKDVLAFALAELRKPWLISETYAYDETYESIKAFGHYYNKACIVVGTRKFVESTRKEFINYIKTCILKGYIHRLTNTVKSLKKVNDALFDLCKTYHKGLPINQIDAILTSNGFNALSEGIYCGKDGRINEEVGQGKYLFFSWHKMEVSGNYEIVSYIS